MTPATALLTRAPAVFRSLLADLPAEWLERPEAPGAWNARDVACHVADLERDAWLPRLRFILERGQEAPLPGVERERFRTTYAAAPIGDVLDDFARLRKQNLAALEQMSLGTPHLQATGRHPLLGEVRAAQLLSTWAAHDLTHQAQIVRALAAPFREAVGPWREYLSVLRQQV